ncbi:MAG: hypothetical protein LBI13_07470 [Streptococcaceae bacterium]|nr:hypothetical protein [Streptococcaceae bacterium]
MCNNYVAPVINIVSNIGQYSNNVQVSGILDKMHKGEVLDLPHLATTLAASENSGFKKDGTKLLAGSPSFSIKFVGGVLYLSTGFDKTVVLQQDGLTGDIWTNINSADYNADVDALIMATDPK